MKSTNIDDWLCLCTPLSCFQRKQTNEDLKCCYDELNSEGVDVIETQIKFIKRCISQDNKIMYPHPDNNYLAVIIDGISRGMDYKTLIKSIDPLITMKTPGSINLFDDNFNDLCLPESKELNTPDLVDAVKGKLQDKLRILEKEHKVMVDRNQDNTAWFNLMFNYIDDDGDGLIEWNQFEIQLEEILQML
ncbi:uncharacterized protein TOT_020000867 [Theileria orientalis strain Shintoku]|uniref:EF-hand domain-containing protein n=1 Tax=Theileria orientalis strain Shintoku TaxID=869250 RepID=J4CD67_THEOR|nr:uncharacterized protein TOT_020000867 [Theileria orientalis strain Shintoku]BAM40612.1 uncharacterized protein TOT_020000867 [Theileria orientalis strain Shintoku]|eukprot:XP_009690913.1 uncharacterized protein TOT_020000867 [Theileria orientalis strain Shintoku]